MMGGGGGEPFVLCLQKWQNCAKWYSFVRSQGNVSGPHAVKLVFFVWGQYGSLHREAERERAKRKSRTVKGRW